MNMAKLIGEIQRNKCLSSAAILTNWKQRPKQFLRGQEHRAMSGNELIQLPASYPAGGKTGPR